MHYRAERKVLAGEYEVIDCIPAFLFLNENNHEDAVLLRFIKIMESEVNNGSSFDMDFFKDCKHYLSCYLEGSSGCNKSEQEIYRFWLSRLDALEDQNIINSHKNKSRFTEPFKTPCVGFYGASEV